MLRAPTRTAPDCRKRCTAVASRVAGGGPALPNVSMAEKRQIFVKEHDWVRRALMFEPRGHNIMSGTILYPPSRDDCDIGVLFIEVSGCLPMSRKYRGF